MPWGEIACGLLLGVTAGLAIALARCRQRAHTPVAVLLCLYLAVTVARWVSRWVLSGEAKPYVGAARLVYFAQEALFVAWGFGLATVLALVFAWRPRWHTSILWLTWAIVEVALVYSYPELRAQPREALYGMLHIAVTGASAVGVGFVMVRAWFGRATETEWMRINPPREAALWMLAGAAVAPFGPYALANPSEDWSTANVISAIVLTALIVRHIQWMNGSKHSSSSTRPGESFASRPPSEPLHRASDSSATLQP